MGKFFLYVYIRAIYGYIGIMMKIGECVGTLMKSEILICHKRVQLVPPDAKYKFYINLFLFKLEVAQLIEHIGQWTLNTNWLIGRAQNVIDK